MQMKFAVVAILALAPVFSAGPARADADDVKWIGQCVSDNKDEGQAVPVVVAYCTCMNNKMSSSENRSITQWEKANPRTAEACSKEAGWKGR
jgi:hypothetical protein